MAPIFLSGLFEADEGKKAATASLALVNPSFSTHIYLARSPKWGRAHRRFD
jgi:hypothetical protein